MSDGTPAAETDYRSELKMLAEYYRPLLEKATTRFDRSAYELDRVIRRGEMPSDDWLDEYGRCEKLVIYLENKLLACKDELCK